MGAFSPRSLPVRRTLALVGAAALAASFLAPANAATKKKTAKANTAASVSPVSGAVPVVTAPTIPRVPFTPSANSALLADDVTGGRPIVRSGSVSSLAGETVQVGGARRATIGSLAEVALAAPRGLQSKLPSISSALFGAPVISEEVAETADATIFTSRTAVTVTDRAAVAARVPELGNLTPRRVQVSQLTSSQRQSLSAYRASLSSKPEGHPLKAAAAGGDQALLDTMARGIVDVTVTSVVRVEKNETPRTGNKALANIPFVPGAVVPEQATFATGSKGVASGTVDHNAKFLTGWSIGDALHWSTTTDLGVARVEVGFHAGYVFGLRVPVEMQGTMTPTLIERTGGEIFGDSYEVKIHDVKAVDGDATLYRNVGLDPDLIANGNEFALQADAYAFAKGDVLGARFNERFPKKPLLDEGKDMRPPYGDCAAECGLNFFFPCNLTKTCINIIGILKGGAQIGFNVGGSGSVSYSYSSLVGGNVVASTRRGTGESSRTHRITTDGRSGTTAFFDTPLPTNITASTPFGYRLSDPAYEWRVEVAPVIKGEVTFDYVLGEVGIDFGPILLPISIELGTLRLGPHDGTQTSVDKVDGSVRLPRGPANASVSLPGNAAPVNAGGAVAPTVGTAPPVSLVPASRAPRTKKGRTTRAPRSAKVGAASASPAASLAPRAGGRAKATRSVQP